LRNFATLGGMLLHPACFFEGPPIEANEGDEFE